MDRGLLFRTTTLAVMWLSLCLLLLSTSPASSAVLEKMNSPSEIVGPDQPADLLHLLRSADIYDRLKKAVARDLRLPQTETRPFRKRGFGIAGLDNVDMITSTLDRSRSKSRLHRPRVSLTVDLNQLRELMAKAG